MIVIVHVVPRIGQEVPAVVVINEAVRVVINSIVWDLVMVDPNVALKVWVCVVYAGVYHTHHHLIRSGAPAQRHKQTSATDALQVHGT